ncbi:MAG: Ig-like domain-containing protein [Alistipes sp.]|jgi:uncharacterized protein (TIGR02145 family)|nr:Ig-like domain-containing protein [Alistipes sp.]
MKKLFFITLAAVGVALSACEPEKKVTTPETVLVESITVEDITLNVSDVETLEAVVLPATADDATVVWSIDDEEIATIDPATGELEALAVGSTTVTATASDESGVTGTCTVTVEAAEVVVESVTLNETELTLGMDDYFVLEATVTPAGTAVSWESENKTVASIDAGGKVTALKEGTSVITATAGDKSATCTVTVVTPVAIESVMINRGVASLLVDATLQLEPLFTPANATNKKVTWMSENEAVATVDKDGLVTALALGEAKITFTTDDGGFSMSCQVKVNTVETLRCSTDAPGWGESLGEVGFATDNTWELGGLTWSDAVVASACDKDTFWGGEGEDDYKSDCRSIPVKVVGANEVNYKGNYFSWCAVVLHQDELCPGEWRVPDSNDFVALNIALGGPGTNQNNPGITQPILPKYASEWGGEFNGWAMNTGAATAQDTDSHYWTAEDRDGLRAMEMCYKRSMFIGPLNYNAKTVGAALRCVK